MNIMSPKVLLIVGIIYLLNPVDIPGPIDDLVVNMITCSLSYYLTMKNKTVDSKAIVKAKEEITVDAPKSIQAGEEKNNTVRSSSF